MIVASALLVLLGLAALLRQLIAGGDGWAYVSLACGVLALAAMAAAALRRRTDPDASDAVSGLVGADAATLGAAQRLYGAVDAPAGSGGSDQSAGPAQQLVDTADQPRDGATDRPTDPADEPGIEASPPEKADWLDTQVGTVSVVDQRPRYHRPTCRHLTGRIAIPMSIGAARGSGFTPCAMCRPNAALLRAADR